MTVDTGHFRALLEDERLRVLAAIENLRHETPGSLEDETDEPALDNHPGDVATVTFDREMHSTLEENSGHVLEAIEAAIAKIEAGTYGTCEACGRPIAEERLAARPWATLCIDDQRRAER